MPMKTSYVCCLLLGVFELLLVDTVCLHAAESAARIEALEKNVDSLKGDLSEIKTLLRGIGAPAAAQPAATQPAGAASAGTNVVAKQVPAAAGKGKMVPGASLEVWGLPLWFSGEALPGRSSGGFVDTGDYFKLSNFWKDKEFASLKNSPVGLAWSGFFKADKEGPYTFTVIANKEETKGLQIPLISWNVELLIAGKSVLRSVHQPHLKDPYGMYAMIEAPYTQADPATVELEPGYYEFQLRTFFFVGKDGLEHTKNNVKMNFADYAPFSIDVKVRGPNDLSARKLDFNTLYLKQD